MSKRKFDLRATIIIYESDPKNHQYFSHSNNISSIYLLFLRHIFIVRDGIGNCLQISLSDIRGLCIEIQTRKYVFHEIEFVERIQSPKELNRWPYENYVPPKKLFCFRSTNNQVSVL